MRAHYRASRGQPVIEAYVDIEGDATTAIPLLEERTLAALGILYQQLDLPFTRQCAGTTAANKPCTHYVDITSPYCGQHGAKRLPPTVLTATGTTMSAEGHPLSARTLSHNVLYVAYARVHGMTVTQRWEADDHHTRPFDLWAAAMRTQFAAQNPAAVNENGTVTDLTAWFFFLRDLRPETLRLREFL